MSVKFEKETTKTTAAVADAVSGKGKDDLLHNVGEALTKGAGPNGYLAVSVAQLEAQLGRELTSIATGVPQAAPEQPAAHQDAHLRNAVRSAGVPRIVDRSRQEQERPLLHLSCAQDGPVRRDYQRASRSRSHQHATEALPGTHQREGQDFADSC